ncbi:hypothetical protein WICMUC_005450 [Wickerhamomyces mucosus]|uniref:Monopolar spindle protein 2 n=1 Tax=Wickerhamomyces mucosus TaxID=1378264 RepID=A0A9P8P7A8_9ASCO|nr:hypothetical protein WICMUC_005450 [Wickerhamomyces mucosus]
MSKHLELFDKAWDQVDVLNKGYIYRKEIELIIDSLESILNSTILSEKHRSQLKDFTKIDSYTKIYKNEYIVLFDSLLDISFSRIIDTASDQLSPFIKSKSHLLNKSRSSSPLKYEIKSEPLLSPAKQANYLRQIKLADDEISYRDEIIKEYKEKENKYISREDQIKAMKKENELLEDDLSEFKKIIERKTLQIEELTKSLETAKEKIKILSNSSNAEGNNPMDNVLLNKALMKRIQIQTNLINELKATVTRLKSQLESNQNSAPVITPKKNIKPKSIPDIPSINLTQLIIPLLTILFLISLTSMFSLTPINPISYFHEKFQHYRYYRVSTIEDDLRTLEMMGWFT